PRDGRKGTIRASHRKGDRSLRLHGAQDSQTLRENPLCRSPVRHRAFRAFRQPTPPRVKENIFTRRSRLIRSHHYLPPDFVSTVRRNLYSPAAAVRHSCLRLLPVTPSFFCPQSGSLETRYRNLKGANLTKNRRAPAAVRPSEMGPTIPPPLT